MAILILWNVSSFFVLGKFLTKLHMFKFWTKQNYTWSRKWLFFLCKDFFWQPYCDHKKNLKSCPFIFLVVHCICKWLNLVVCIDLQKHQMYLFQCASRSRYTLLLTAHFISRKNLWDETNALSHVWELQQERGFNNEILQVKMLYLKLERT